MSKDNKVVSLDEKRGEIETAQMNDQWEERAKLIEWETDKLMRSIYTTLTEITTSKQAVAAGMAMLLTGKDLLVLELGQDAAKAYIDSLDLDTAEVVERQINESLRGRTDIPENDGGDKEGSRIWTEEELVKMKGVTSSTEPVNEGDE